MGNDATQSPPGVACQNHPEESALARCGSCSRRLCDACLLRTVDGAPWCEACVFDLESAHARRWPLGVTFGVLCLLAAIAGRRYEARVSGEASPEVWGTVLAAGLVGAVFFVVRGGQDHGRTIAVRAAQSEVEFSVDTRAAHPYRAKLKQVVKQVAPPLSGRGTTAVLLLCMVVCAVTLPAMLGLPRVLEAELVVALWWMVWTATLSVLLYRGFRLSNDHVYRWPFQSSDEQPAPAKAARRKVNRGSARKRKRRPRAEAKGRPAKFEWKDLGAAIQDAAARPAFGPALPSPVLRYSPHS